jgi:ribosomal protein L11 methyltransferase
MGLHEISVDVAPAAVDEIEGVLLELGLDRWSLREDVISGRAWLIGVFGGAAEARSSWDELHPRLEHLGLPAPGIRRLADSDWRDSYKAHFKAWHFGRLHWVPVWERDSFSVPAGERVLWLDPGLAFGTGNHETTRLCVERLVELAAKNHPAGDVIDAGCGSGILALSAALLGFREIAGFDRDPEAVRVSKENAALNGLEGRVQFFTGDIVQGLNGCTAAVLLANIQADVLERFAPELLAAIAPGGTLVLSGILGAELEHLRKTFVTAAPGWSADSRVLGEWADLTLSRPPS